MSKKAQPSMDCRTINSTQKEANILNNGNINECVRDADLISKHCATQYYVSSVILGNHLVSSDKLILTTIVSLDTSHLAYLLPIFTFI